MITEKTVSAVLDGTYLHHRHGMFAALNSVSHHLIYGAYGITEGPIGLGIFCRRLCQHGIVLKSVTIDGNTHLFRVLTTTWPGIIIQRCLVHIQRQGLSWCRQKPKRADARSLRRIFEQVLSIRTHQQKKAFLRKVTEWEHRYGSPFHQPGTIHGWVATDLQRARSMLFNALPYMFQYLNDATIPFSTNMAEGYFSRLKKRYRAHQGIVHRYRKEYFRWYFYLCEH